MLGRNGGRQAPIIILVAGGIATCWGTIRHGRRTERRARSTSGHAGYPDVTYIKYIGLATLSEQRYGSRFSTEVAYGRLAMVQPKLGHYTKRQELYASALRSMLRGTLEYVATYNPTFRQFGFTFPDSRLFGHIKSLRRIKGLILCHSRASRQRVFRWLSSPIDCAF